MIRRAARCTECGKVPVGSWRISLTGEVTCTSHEALGACFSCGRPLCTPVVLPWHTLEAGMVRCPTCGVDAIDDRQAMAAQLPVLRSQLADLGFVLARKVPVALTDAATLRADRPGDSPTPLGATRLIGRGRRQVEVTRIDILAGLPRVVFGRTVSHEVGHAWLAMAGSRALDQEVEEGFCELAAYAWLRREGSPLALGMRKAIRENPDPVYGVGFRRLHAAVRVHGLNAIVEELARSGRLPQ